jgi:hypothetical protein
MKRLCFEVTIKEDETVYSIDANVWNCFWPTSKKMQMFESRQNISVSVFYDGGMIHENKIIYQYYVNRTISFDST